MFSQSFESIINIIYTSSGVFEKKLKLIFQTFKLLKGEGKLDGKDTILVEITKFLEVFILDILSP